MSFKRAAQAIEAEDSGRNKLGAMSRLAHICEPICQISGQTDQGQGEGGGHKQSNRFDCNVTFLFFGNSGTDGAPRLTVFERVNVLNNMKTRTSTGVEMPETDGKHEGGKLKRLFLSPHKLASIG